MLFRNIVSYFIVMHCAWALQQMLIFDQAWTRRVLLRMAWQLLNIPFQLVETGTLTSCILYEEGAVECRSFPG